MSETNDATPARRRIRPLAQEEKRTHRRLLAAEIGTSGAWPLNAPGMPLPGVDFIAAAAAMGDATEYKKPGKKAVSVPPGEQLTELYRRALREPGFTLEVKVKDGLYRTVTLVPGHVWGQHAAAWRQAVLAGQDAPRVDGPRPAEVFVLGKMPWREETQEGRNLMGVTGEILKDVVEKLHILGADKWYVTNLCKFMPPDDTRDLKAAWVHDCLPLLHQELRIVKPKYILCLGAEPSKWLLGDKFTVAHMAGRVIPYPIDMRMSAADEATPHTAHVMTVIHPINVAKDPAQARILEANMGRFANLLTTHNLDLEERGIDHRSCYTLEDAVEWIAEATFELSRQPAKLRLTAWDLEWEGQHPVNAGSYVRTIQCSWADRKSMCFVVSHPGGSPAFRDREGTPAVPRLVAALNEFVKRTRPVGHFLVSDMEWAEHIGLKLIDHAAVPLYDKDGRKAWEVFRDGRGWLDTGMMNHAIEETAPLGLEMLTMRYTMAPRYDVALDEWKEKQTLELRKEGKALKGYGECSDKVLINYANYDADVTRRIALTLLPLLDEDYEGNNCWEPFWESMIIQTPILRMHQNGIVVDRTRVDDLTKKFITWRAKKEEEIRDWARWHDAPVFNIRSVQHVKEFLFGEEYNGRPRGAGGAAVRIRPEGARSLYLTPLLDTSKPPRWWRDLVDRNLHHDASPGTGKAVLGILAQENLNRAGEIGMIRDYRFLDQVLKSVLRVPRVDEADNWVEDDDGFLEYNAGLVHCIDDDGLVRTNLYPTAETGRWKSSRPPLQNLCCPGDHEVLTRRGWVRLDSLPDSTAVAQFDPATEAVDFVVPSCVVRRRLGRNEKLLRLAANKQIELVGTANHRCLVRRRRSKKWVETTIDAVPEDCHYYHTGVYHGGTTVLSPAWVTFLAAVQADGNYPKQGGGIVFVFIKSRKIAALRKALIEVCPEAIVTKRSRGTYVYVPVKSNANRVARELMPDKCFGPWLLDLDTETMTRFAEEVFFWDGNWTRRTEYSSGVERNVDWVQALWTLVGWRARKRQAVSQAGNTHWYVSTTDPRQRVGHSTTTGRTITPVTGTDRPNTVYCVTVPTSYFLVRYNGKVSVTGNSKSRDQDYRRLLGGTLDASGNWVGGDYTHPLRSVLTATPGFALIEADYKGAELYGMAIMSGSARMQDHCRRALLADKGYDDQGNETAGGKCAHPAYYDIHANVACLAFRLQCEPTKKGLKSIGKEHFRTLAKNIIFGLAYGRQAKAIALQAKEQGIHVTVNDAQTVIDAVFELYPELPPFFEEARSRALKERWLCHCFGRFRRFPRTKDYKLEGEFERQAMNFPIQGMIASCVDRAVAFLNDVIDRQGLRAHIRILLTIHDAVLVEAAYAYVEHAQKLIQWAFVDMVEIWPTDLAGNPRGDGPYRLGLDFETMLYWSEGITKSQCVTAGIDPQYGK